MKVARCHSTLTILICFQKYWCEIVARRECHGEPTLAIRRRRPLSGCWHIINTWRIFVLFHFIYSFFFNKKEKLWQYMKPWLLKDTIHQSCRASPPDVPVCATLLETSHRVLPPGPNFAVDLEYLRMLRASHYQSYSVNLAGVGCLHAF